MKPTLANLLQIITALPRDPIAPQHRKIARLHPSAYVEPGQVFRLAPHQSIVGHAQPLIVMNADDVGALRAIWAELPFGLALDIDQEIADCCEQLFADRARAESKPWPPT